MREFGFIFAVGLINLKKYGALGYYVTPAIQGKAKAKLAEWFGEVDEAELNLF